MAYLDAVLARLESARSCGYHDGADAATEPAALGALALVSHHRDAAALRMLDWLSGIQAADGTVGVSAAQSNPCWPTGWAVVAWHAASKTSYFDAKFPAAVERACDWIVRSRGMLLEKLDKTGHDTTITGWPWVEGTHSWIEPTAIQLLALKHVGRGDHARAREAVRLLQDRLLPSGGCNYGNTVVLDQELLPHVQPTGLCLLALAGEEDSLGRMHKAIEYLQRELSSRTTTASLSYALMGLAAHDATPTAADQWLAAAAERTLARDASCYKLALLALASMAASCPLIPALEAGAKS